LHIRAQLLCILRAGGAHGGKLIIGPGKLRSGDGAEKEKERQMSHSKPHLKSRDQQNRL
jgi:hypothetical protein